MIQRILLLGSVIASSVYGFAPSATQHAFATRTTLQMAAESEVDFGDLDGSDVRIGIIRTRWNNEDVTRLVSGAKLALSDCKVEEDNIFETEVPGAFELPYAAKLLAMSGTVDAIICAGVLIKGDTMHFEYIADAVSKGIMNVGINTNTPVVFGVLTCMNHDQVKARSTGESNHGYDWGKTAVEMALLKSDAMGGGKMSAMGFSTGEKLENAKKELVTSTDKKDKKEKGPGFF